METPLDIIPVPSLSLNGMSALDAELNYGNVHGLYSVNDIDGEDLIKGAGVENP
jgi:hypothetical protein